MYILIKNYVIAQNAFDLDIEIMISFTYSWGMFNKIKKYLMINIHKK